MKRFGSRNAILIGLVIAVALSAASALMDDHMLSLVFEVENGAEFCLFKHFNRSIAYRVEYGVINGGNLDIGFKLLTANGNEIVKRDLITASDFFEFESSTFGDYQFCFDNTFSTVSHKVVFFDLRPADENYLLTLQQETDTNLPMVLGPIETSLNDIHKLMSNASVVQLFYRHQESVDKNMADKLNQSVMVWSASLSLSIVIMSIVQVTALKRFFITRVSKPKGLRF